MKKWILLSSLFLAILLAGCTEKSSVDGETQSEPAMENEEPEILRPPHLQVHASSDNAKPVAGQVDTACWESEEGSCSIERESLQGIQEILLGEQPLRASPGESVSLSVSMSAAVPNNENLLSHDGFKLTRVGTDDDQEIEVRGDRFSVPEDNGRHHYSVSVLWDNDELQGEAIYAFSVLVYEGEE